MESNLNAILSIISIFAAIAIGNLRRINIGLISIALAFLTGFLIFKIPATEIVAGWPLNLFFVLFGMTLLFGIARINGTLELLAHKTVELTVGRIWLIPVIFFLLSGFLASLGPGNIATCALILPIAMTIGSFYKIPTLLIATMVIAGANAGGLSPLAPTGIIAESLISKQGFNISMRIFYEQVIVQTLFAIILFFILKGYKLKNDTTIKTTTLEPFKKDQLITLLVILMVVLGIILGKWNIGLTAFAGSSILIFMGVVNEKKAIESVPWTTILLVCGVTVLVKVSENAGGIDLLSKILSVLMSSETVAPLMAFTGGLFSLFSSASGVVMPTLIPTVPHLVAETGGEPSRIISAIIVGAHMVTNSPISTLGALTLASVGSDVDKTKLFNRLFIVGISGVFFAAFVFFVGIV